MISLCDRSFSKLHFASCLFMYRYGFQLQEHKQKFRIAYYNELA